MTTKKEHLEHLAKIVDEAKQKLSEAANYAAEHELQYSLDLYGSEFYISNLNDRLSYYDPEDAHDREALEYHKKEFLERFGVNEGYIWASSSTFCY